MVEPQKTVGQIRSAAYHASLEVHQIKCKGLVGMGLPVVLLSSDNPYLRAGARGVLFIIEQGTDLSVNVAVFHRLGDDGRLGAPVRCGRPVFVYTPFDFRAAREIEESK